MPNNHSILIGISLLALICAGIYLSMNTNLENLVNSTNEGAVASTSSMALSPKNCSFDTAEVPEHIPVIINEIAWMGSATNSRGEWIELVNLSSSTISIGGWEFVSQTAKIKIVFRSGAQISANGFYLLERGSKDFLQGPKADNFFAGVLKNTGDSFRLFDKYCSLRDEVMASFGWPAGDNVTKKTMERDSKTFKWYTSSSIGGTPGAENDHFVKTIQASSEKSSIKKTTKSAGTKASSRLANP